MLQCYFFLRQGKMLFTPVPEAGWKLLAVHVTGETGHHEAPESGWCTE